ncbi:molybdopterin-dependent oxidoreductase [Chloroflexota bacterium]
MKTKVAELSQEKVVRTVCHGCHSLCGVLVTVKNRKAVKIEGDPEHPYSRGMMCPKGFAFIQNVYHPDRPKYPLKRVGERGEGKWQRISWDEALDIVASKFTEVREKYGPRSMVFHAGGNTRRAIQAMYVLAHSVGSPNVSYTDSHYCWGPYIVAEMFTYGGLLLTEIMVDSENSKCILLWGGNPMHAYPASGRKMHRGLANGARLIVVDPKFTGIASKADIWLQIRPGTDDALALGFLNVIINEELYDKEFVDKWCIGFDELRKRVQDFPPQKVADITWLKADDIVRAARMYATIKPSCLYSSAALEMENNSVQALRGLASLVAITGQLDVKGANVFQAFPKGFLPSFFYFRKKFRPSDEIEEQRLGAKEFPLFAGPKSPFGTFHAPTVIKAMLTDDPYPIKAWMFTNDIQVCLPNSRDVNTALKRVPFIVALEIAMTTSVEMADIVLPSATWMEIEEITDREGCVVAREKSIEPVGECKDEMWVTFEIIKRMGLKCWLEGVESPMDYNDYRLKSLGIDFDELKKRHVVLAPRDYKGYEKFGSFRTASRKVELYSETFKEHGYDPLPNYVEPPESPISTPELYKEYPFILISGGRRLAYVHSMGRQIPWLRELVPDPEMDIHPQTAEKLGIKEGDWVWLEVPASKERIRQRAKLTLAMDPRVVHAHSHWWYPEKPGPDHGQWDVNINKLISGGPPYDPIAGTTILRGSLCKIYKTKEDEL